MYGELPEVRVGRVTSVGRQVNSLKEGIQLADRDKDLGGKRKNLKYAVFDSGMDDAFLDFILTSTWIDTFLMTAFLCLVPCIHHQRNDPNPNQDELTTSPLPPSSLSSCA